MKHYLLLLLLLCPYQIALANLSLNIEVVHKKGIDKGLVLVNEVHSIEDFDFNEERAIKINKEWIIFLKASFHEGPDKFGPSEKINVQSSFLKKNKSGDELVKEKDFLIGLGQKRFYEHNHSSDQIIEISITPHIR